MQHFSQILPRVCTSVLFIIIALDIDSQCATQRYALAMITTLMPHLRIGPYKEGVTIDQIQMLFDAVGRSFSYELLVIVINACEFRLQRQGKVTNLKAEPLFLFPKKKDY